MSPSVLVACQPTHCELRFQSLAVAGLVYAFPCDSAGRVDMDALSDRARRDYFYARAVMGRELSRPAVTVCRGQ